MWDLTGNTDFLLFQCVFHVLNYSVINSTFVASLIYSEVSQGLKTISSFIDETCKELRRKAWNLYTFQNLKVGKS